MRTFAKIAETEGKGCVKVLYKVFVNMFYILKNWSFLANYENIH